MPRIMGARLPFGPIDVELDGLTNREQADRCGIHCREISRYRVEGVPVGAADTIAIRLGLHPLLLWGTSWSEAEHAWENLKAESRENRRLHHLARQKERAAEKRAWVFMERRRWQWVEQHERRIA